jgi:hypothetical protein
LEKYLHTKWNAINSIFWINTYIRSSFFKINSVDFGEYTKDFLELKSCKKKWIVTSWFVQIRTKQIILNNFGLWKKTNFQNYIIKHKFFFTFLLVQQQLNGLFRNIIICYQMIDLVLSN